MTDNIKRFTDSKFSGGAIRQQRVGPDKEDDRGIMERRQIVINGKFLGGGLTGVHRVAHELLSAITDSGRLDCEILTPSGEPMPALRASLPVRAVGHLHGQLWEQIDLPRAAQGRLILSLCNLAPVATRNAVTMIHDAQVFITPESYSLAFGAWYRLILRQIGRRHRRILTVSHFSKQQLIRYDIAPAERIEVIHNGADHILRVAADPGILGRLGLERHGYAVGLANTQSHKNITLLLRAFARPDMARLKLVLVGGASRTDFEALGKLVPANVIFAGSVADDALRGLLEGALCLAFPSLTEGFGLPPLEAMVLGCPAVIAPCGALPEVCGSAAIKADPADPAAWSSAILSLARDAAAWSTRSAAGRRHAAEFTWKRAAALLRAALADLAVAA
jgi:glycosyltransferase involved in cell wall biosynthesis